MPKAGPIDPKEIKDAGVRAKVEQVEQFAKEQGFNLEVYGPELSMSASADRLVELMKKS